MTEVREITFSALISRYVGQDVVMYAIDEEGVFLIGAPVGKGQHGDRFLWRSIGSAAGTCFCDSFCLLRLGFQIRSCPRERERHGYRQQPDDREVELAARHVGDGLSGINSRFALEPLRRQLERPGNDQGQREAEDQRES